MFKQQQSIKVMPCTTWPSRNPKPGWNPFYIPVLFTMRFARKLEFTEQFNHTYEWRLASKRTHLLLHTHRSWCMYQHPSHRRLLCHAASIFLAAAPLHRPRVPPAGRVLHTSTNCPLGNLAVPHDLLTRGPFQINQISPLPLPPSRIIFNSSEQ